MNAQRLQLYLTVEHDCGYFSDRLATNLVPDPQVPMNMPLYSLLIQHGYRRSGAQSYRPYCNGCRDCIACRVPVDRFKPNRNQRRCLKKNADLTCKTVTATFTDEYFQLYRSYLNVRHTDGNMANPDKDDFNRFLYCDWCETKFIEVRKDDRLLAVAVCDITDTGLSAVYTFFDPKASDRSLGTYCILQQILQAKSMNLPYLYMGYWIQNCQKMQYKVNFRPMQFFIDDSWTEEQKPSDTKPGVI